MKSVVKLKNDIIHLTLTKKIDESEAEEIIKNLEQIFQKSSKNKSILVSFNEYITSDYKARFLAGEFLKSIIETIPKIALVGKINPAFEFAAKVVLGYTAFKKYRFFNSPKEAISWLEKAD